MRGNLKKKHTLMVNHIFVLSAVIALVIAAWGIVGSESFAAAVDLLMVLLKQKFSWLDRKSVV